jgi:ABC-type spermidine/putrescine transport system permease subunit I
MLEMLPPAWARRVGALWRVTLPLSLPGPSAARSLVFAMSMGAYTTPALLVAGGASSFPS